MRFLSGGGDERRRARSPSGDAAGAIALGQPRAHAERAQRAVTLATLPGADDNYLRKTPGLYPDLLSDRLRTHLQAGLWHAFWVEVTPEGAAAGDYEIQLQLLHADTGEVLSQASACVRILPGFLPEQTLRRTSWFHSDCLAQYYRVPVFSAEHWQLIERFMAVAARRGVNMILTPLFTPPLDTAVGGERPTVQLVGVRQSPEGWQFDFSLLRRWVAAARRAGMEYFEMSHLFTQWARCMRPRSWRIRTRARCAYSAGKPPRAARNTRAFCVRCCRS